MTGTIDARTTVLLARSALLLWPRGESGHVEADLWPVFAVVVEERDLRRAPGGRALLGRIDGRTPVTLLDGVATWSVLSADAPLLALGLRATAPVPVSLDVVLPARALLGELDRLAAGPTVGITTTGRAGALDPGVEIRTALRRVALSRSAPSADVAAVARR